MVDKEPLKEYALPKILIYLVIYLIGGLTKRAESLFRFQDKNIDQNAKQNETNQDAQDGEK